MKTEHSVAIDDARRAANYTNRDQVVLTDGRRVYVRDRQKSIPAGAWLVAMIIPNRFDNGDDAIALFPNGKG